MYALSSIRTAILTTTCMSNIPTLLPSLANHDPLQQRVYIGHWPLAAKELSVPAHFHEMFPSSVSLCSLLFIPSVSIGTTVCFLLP